MSGERREVTTSEKHPHARVVKGKEGGLQKYEHVGLWFTLIIFLIVRRMKVYIWGTRKELRDYVVDNIQELVQDIVVGIINQCRPQVKLHIYSSRPKYRG